ncbi:sodium:calcium antiporter [Haloarchaeobius amylolyticus]|uniref:sodium:calcium antiporter n=1 Tax=Haloarchaeobius amylolyticus TaxID=1198296 RepID=UPI00226DDE51|nr:sodium:calcium antiporter [Haloarchaeobius amylolyticus]
MVSGGPVVQIGVIVLSVLGLWVGARLLVDAAVRSARRFGLSELTIGLTIVAVGTSTPELAVAVDAARKGLGDIAVANVLGSNIYNLAFVLGVIALLRAVPVADSVLRREGVVLLASTLVGGLVLFDSHLSRLEGVLLVGLFVAYTAFLLTRDQSEVTGSAERPLGDGGVTRPVTERVSVPGRDVVFLVAGLALVLVSGDYMVLAASALARGAGISEWVIGGTIVAAGTSTPEFAVSLVAIRQRSLGVSVGNVVGSNVLNITGIMGLAAVIQPIAVSGSVFSTLAWLVVVVGLVVAALWTERVLSRVEGAVFTASELARWVVGML